jgi:hypothetical protein
MNDYIFFMHNDAPDRAGDRGDAWSAYVAKLRQAGAFQGGSAIGDGICASRSSSTRGHHTAPLGVHPYPGGKSSIAPANW